MRNPVSRFAYAQSDINIGRSRFDRTHDHKTTISAGKLYPILCDEVLPGDTYSVDMSSLVRMATPIHPVMDNCWLDTYWFFVPNRIVWDHWKEFMGESPEDPYINPVQYTVPAFYQNEDPGGDESFQPIPHKSVLDYLGCPAGTAPKRFSQLPVRGFCKIWNEWFRDQNLQNAINVSTGDEDLTYSTRYNNWASNNETAVEAYVENSAHGGDLPPVNKYHDYFTSALKEPQKGDPVGIPLSGFAPVYATNAFGLSGYSPDYSIPTKITGLNDLRAVPGNIGSDISGNMVANSSTAVTGTQVRISNLGADLSNVAGVYATISDLRYAFQLQKFMEADNRGGTRYREILKQHFNVTSPDASIQIPEFLGGKRVPINMSQVLQTSATNDVTPQGNTAAYSLTSDKYSAFTKSFTEHGFIFCVACIRTDHTYSQGLEKMWFRFDKFDYYFPEFANISEMPIYNKEIFNEAYTATDHELGEEIFGFQEAWAEYRYKPNRLSAEFRSNYLAPLDVWHYGDDYEDQPFLSAGWIRETRKNIDRTLAVNDNSNDQFICDFYFKLNTTRVMPMYSIPGLADHH